MSKTKLVMAFGTFDYFHAGHEYYLEQARQFGDKLYVVIARDDTVKKIKGFFPHNDAQQRRKAVANFHAVDAAFIGHPTNKYQHIAKHAPDVICLGYDQHAFTQQLRRKLIQLNLNTAIHRIEPYKPELYKSSIIKQQLAQ